MKITYTPPAERGVTTLMYVGDDQAVERATSGPSSIELLAGTLAAYLALGTRGVVRAASGGYAAYLAYRLLTSSR